MELKRRTSNREDLAEADPIRIERRGIFSVLPFERERITGSLTRSCCSMVPPFSGAHVIPGMPTEPFFSVHRIRRVMMVFNTGGNSVVCGSLETFLF
jgi:hypothetical protein